MRISKWNVKAFEQIRFTSAAAAACEKPGKAMMAQLGEGYAMSSGRGKTRHRVGVYTRTNRAKRDNARHNSLIKALGSAHG